MTVSCCFGVAVFVLVLMGWITTTLAAPVLLLMPSSSTTTTSSSFSSSSSTLSTSPGSGGLGGTSPSSAFLLAHPFVSTALSPPHSSFKASSSSSYHHHHPAHRTPRSSVIAQVAQVPMGGGGGSGLRRSPSRQQHLASTSSLSSLDEEERMPLSQSSLTSLEFFPSTYRPVLSSAKPIPIPRPPLPSPPGGLSLTRDSPPRSFRPFFAAPPSKKLLLSRFTSCPRIASLFESTMSGYMRTIDILDQVNARGVLAYRAQLVAASPPPATNHVQQLFRKFMTPPPPSSSSSDPSPSNHDWLKTCIEAKFSREFTRSFVHVLSELLPSIKDVQLRAYVTEVSSSLSRPFSEVTNVIAQFFEGAFDKQGTIPLETFHADLETMRSAVYSPHAQVMYSAAKEALIALRRQDQSTPVNFAPHFLRDVLQSHPDLGALILDIQFYHSIQLSLQITHPDVLRAFLWDHPTLDFVSHGRTIDFWHNKVHDRLDHAMHHSTFSLFLSAQLSSKFQSRPQEVIPCLEAVEASSIQQLMHLFIHNADPEMLGYTLEGDTTTYLMRWVDRVEGETKDLRTMYAADRLFAERRRFEWRQDQSQLRTTSFTPWDSPGDMQVCVDAVAKVRTLFPALKDVFRGVPGLNGGGGDAQTASPADASNGDESDEDDWDV